MKDMDKIDAYDFNKINNPKEIKSNLINASLFLAYYEILKNTIVNRIEEFLNDYDFNKGKIVTSDDYKEQIIKPRYNEKENIFLSSCDWLVSHAAITSDDKSLIIQIKEERNRIAHNIPKYLFESNYCIKKEFFSQIKDLILKIEKWWIIEYEITLNPNIDLQTIDINSIVPGKDITLTYIFNIANSDLEELEKLIHNFIIEH